MSIKTFEDLEIWKRGHQLTLSIYTLTKNFPAEERYGITSQMRRSVSSMCANIAVGSLEETKYHLILSKDLSYCSQDTFKELYNESCEISSMITTIIKKLRGKYRF